MYSLDIARLRASEPAESRRRNRIGTSRTELRTAGSRVVRQVLLLFGAGVVAAAAAQSAAAAGWSIEPVPKPPNSGDTELSGVSCTSTRACVAVGWRDVPATNDPVPLVERWNGSTWSTEHTPMSNTAGWSGSLSAVSCASSSACVAVGLSYGDNSSSGPFAERWDGSSWSIERIPQLGDAEALDGVSCASSTDCTAVGYGKSSVAAHWNGTRWSAREHSFRRPGRKAKCAHERVLHAEQLRRGRAGTTSACAEETSTTSTASPYLDSGPTGAGRCGGIQMSCARTAATPPGGTPWTGSRARRQERAPRSAPPSTGGKDIAGRSNRGQPVPTD